jgi:hypothetical protein
MGSGEVRAAMSVEDRLDKIEKLLLVLVERQQAREWYAVEEFARIVDRAEFTVREWCRHGRIKAEKKDSGRGAYASWAISHGELLRFQREGSCLCAGSPDSIRLRSRWKIATANFSSVGTTAFTIAIVPRFPRSRSI